MGFSDGNFKPRTFANIKQEKGTGNIHFSINQGEGQPPLIKRDFTGRLKEVKIKNWEWEGKKKESIQFIFDDGEGEVWIECGWSMVSKGILNTLDGADAIGQVMIALYKNKKGYASAFVEVNGQKVGWKYQPNQLPLAEKKMIRGEEVFDDYEQVQFYKNTIIPEINSKIQNEFLVESEMTNQDKPKEYQQATGNTNIADEAVKSKAFTGNHEDIESDLPFFLSDYRHLPTQMTRRYHPHQNKRATLI